MNRSPKAMDRIQILLLSPEQNICWNAVALYSLMFADWKGSGSILTALEVLLTQSFKSIQ